MLFQEQSLNIEINLYINIDIHYSMIYLLK